MSLHLGNLSSRVRRHELERIFQRFGRCTVQIKDKFGFVVYEYPSNAEKALGALRGTRICGERITLSWSKKQPQPPQSYFRRGRTYEQPQGRHFPNARQGHNNNFRKADIPPDLIDGPKAEGMEGCAGEKGHDYVQYMSEKGGYTEANNLENDTWEEKVFANNLSNGQDFDRYEPCLDDDMYSQQGFRESTHQDCSPTARKSEGKTEMEQVPEATLEQSNYLKCRHFGERINDYQEKKGSSKEHQPSDEKQLKKCKVPGSSSIHSDKTASGSQAPSKSIKSLPGPHTCLRSKSTASRKQSLSSSSRSGSMSSRHRITENVSQQLSRSSSPTSLALSDTLDRPPNKMQINHDDMVCSSLGELKEGSLHVDNDTSSAPVRPAVYEKNSHSSGGNNRHAIVGNVTEMKRSSLTQSEDRSQDPGTYSARALTKTKELEIMREETEASQRSTVASLMNISSEEVCKVLKNCSQKYCNAIEGDLSPRTYFGCGRLWPWEVIYYRRLKKGPISKENYARRLFQNQQFGIVDKYIRSSSGWGELANENR
ncbi:OLC1v1034116C1 [Oldenlandia corymbosa var. corymbosa]|uniref:OLC1v1034116C1 n=1 Tax=Oldenlandia corymbosa var. corymbosa TaxID=529605 RepID=A0AAV1CQJ0_OLDCO|nr:OLC1v1034116C1 [Oldenlandia corymbosa var. corymbosa]